MRRQSFIRCHQPRKHGHGLYSTTVCGSLLWPEDLQAHLQEEHGVEEGQTEMVEDTGNQTNTQFCDCGEPAVYIETRDRKCETCRRSESRTRPPLREGYCTVCRTVRPQDGDVTCGSCLEKARGYQPAPMGRPSVAGRGR